MAGRRQLDERRLRATIAYITGKTFSGKLKLFKLLYLIDFTAYVELGRSVTGECYKAAKLGPVPEYLSDNFDTLILDTVILTKTDIGADNPEFRMSPLDSAPPISVVDLEERKVIDQVLAAHGSKSGKQLTEMTHHELPYRLRARDRQHIPYRLAGYRNFHKLSQSEIATIAADPEYVRRVRKGLAWYDSREPEDEVL
jgi:uncharacterized phage-associated protein